MSVLIGHPVLIGTKYPNFRFFVLLSFFSQTIANPACGGCTPSSSPDAKYIVHNLTISSDAHCSFKNMTSFKVWKQKQPMFWQYIMFSLPDNMIKTVIKISDYLICLRYVLMSHLSIITSTIKIRICFCLWMHVKNLNLRADELNWMKKIIPEQAHTVLSSFMSQWSVVT